MPPPKSSPADLLTRFKETRKPYHRDALMIKGYVIYPSALSQARRYLNRAQDKGLIRDPREYTIGVSALLSAAMAEANEANVKYVSPRHVAKGWTERLSVGGGNCPPHLCFKSSVLARVDHLKETVPHLSEFLDLIEESK
jgi:hypothetical protein